MALKKLIFCLILICAVLWCLWCCICCCGELEPKDDYCCLLPSCPIEPDTIQNNTYNPGEIVISFPKDTKVTSRDAINFINAKIENFNVDRVRNGDSPIEELEASAVRDSCICNHNLFLIEADELFGIETGLANHSNPPTTPEGPKLDLNHIFSIGERLSGRGFLGEDSIQILEEIEMGEESTSNITLLAILDTGLKPFVLPPSYRFDPDILPGVQWWIDIFDSNSSLDDSHGHGTTVFESFSKALVFIDPEPSEMQTLKILPIKVLDDDGVGTSFSISCGLYCADEEGADVVNMSLGNYSTNVTLLNAFKEITEDNQIKIVTSAGNKNYDLSLIEHSPSFLSRATLQGFEQYNGTNISQVIENNVFEVGALCATVDDFCSDTENLWPNSNYSDGMIVAPGIFPIIDADNVSCYQAGTSIASGAFSAAVWYELINRGHLGLKNNIINNTSNDFSGINGNTYYSYFPNKCNP